MKILIDATRCDGYGMCAEHCPSMFKLDEFGFPQIQHAGIVPAGEEGRVTEAVNQCPLKALSFEKTGS